ncbi:MAG: hypothetical protein LBE92_01195 [Chryseobacterium sp.]|jgi:hypothetical protein|uniref:hypothetical protein n=1 Tax=Chryseobacterium sp. TaxID=1871047 RepID=UPI002830BD63|nr:hypothetical protein [Chryseobacterium sp.]MDR2234714.1 hypothetical protein [Chryseobacterium sp.]
MKTIIKELLIELTLNGKKSFHHKILDKIDEEMEVSDSVSLTNLLMQWHKKIKKGSPFAQYQSDYLQLSELMQAKYKILFEKCPELSELYEFNNDRIYFNAFLTDADKQEILDYVDDNYKIIRHSYGRKL